MLIYAVWLDDNASLNQQTSPKSRHVSVGTEDFVPDIFSSNFTQVTKVNLYMLKSEKSIIFLQIVLFSSIIVEYFTKTISTLCKQDLLGNLL